MVHEEKEILTLYELNNIVHDLVEMEMDTYRVKAELSDVKASGKGYCFVELIEKARNAQVPKAKARGIIPSDRYALIKMDFEETTGQMLQSGMEILMEVKPTFSEIYGYSLIILDIDATYTLGDMARKRLEIIKRLEEEGVAQLQKELTLPTLVKRIAVISSETAAGYGDFCHQLDNNDSKYRFVHKLFQATMQGNQTEESIINALSRIYEEIDDWDVVIIIRGGGAVSDLSGFETYELANNCAQFPLPIITGIGHQRDQTVLDLVAHLSLKTPTAVSDFLLHRMGENAETAKELHERMRTAVADRLNREKNQLSICQEKVMWFARNFKQAEQMRLSNLIDRIKKAIQNNEERQLMMLGNLKARLTNAARHQIERSRQWLELTNQKITLNDPQRILDLGYSITLRNGKPVKRASEVKTGDEITTRLKDGNITSIVK